MKTKIVVILGMIILIGIASANLVSYLSGVVTGKVTVEGPVFYAVSGAGTNGAPGKLFINDNNFEGESYIIKGGDTKYFKTEKINPISFYAPKLKLSVEASLENNSDFNLLELKFGVYNKFSKGIENPFCSVVINVTSLDYQIYSGICDGKSVDTLEAFYYSIHNMGTNDVEIQMETSNKNTKAEIIGVAS